MTKINNNVAIQFIKGKDERDRPEIRLFRNIDGKKGQAVYKFHKPSTITPENFNSIKEMYLIDEEGELSTKKINLSKSDNKNNNNMEVSSTYSWNTEKEFERFMRFAKRHANSLTKY